MKHYAFAHRLPGVISDRLFGARKEFGLVPDETDPCWLEWQSSYHEFYESTQKKGAGHYVNNIGYSVVSDIDFTGKKVLEVGPGSLTHAAKWYSIPDKYVVVDIDPKFLEKASNVLTEKNVEHEKRLSSRGAVGLPAEDSEFDYIVSFYSLEHLYPFEKYLNEFLRVLKPGGKIIGAIPAEGGLAWGLGRYLTSRRWLKQHTNINPDKIICWEHPNFADHILYSLGKEFKENKVSFWPLGIPSVDMNLVIMFEFEKRK